MSSVNNVKHKPSLIVKAVSTPLLFFPIIRIKNCCKLLSEVGLGAALLEVLLIPYILIIMRYLYDGEDSCLEDCQLYINVVT